MLNKQAGNMYTFVTHTWNAISGKCPHDCEYCYMKEFPQKDAHLNEKELETDLGTGNFIFVGSSIDMFASEIPEEWIKKVLKHCRKFDNTYLFQTKNPFNFWKFISEHPKNIILGTTIETNRDYQISKAPSVFERAEWLENNTVKTMVTIEPIMDFDLEELVAIVKKAKPEWVNIGADSKGHNLHEPSKEKIEALIRELSKFTQVKLKDNLKRLMK